MQPATAMRSIYSLSSGLRKYSNQMIINGRTLLAVEKTMKISKRKMRHATEKNVICSSFEDIELPNCTLNEFIFKGMDQWPDKTAVVSIFLYSLVIKYLRIKFIKFYI